MADLDLRDTQERRRRSDGGEELKDAPWPVRAVAVIGGMTCIACFLVWFLANTVANGQNEIKAAVAPMPDHIKSSERLGGVLEAIERDHRDSNRRIEKYMQLMCIGGARTQSDRRDCMGVDR